MRAIKRMLQPNDRATTATSHEDLDVAPFGLPHSAFCILDSAFVHAVLRIPYSVLPVSVASVSGAGLSITHSQYDGSHRGPPWAPRCSRPVIFLSLFPSSFRGPSPPGISCIGYAFLNTVGMLRFSLPPACQRTPDQVPVPGSTAGFASPFPLHLLRILPRPPNHQL